MEPCHRIAPFFLYMQVFNLLTSLSKTVINKQTLVVNYIVISNLSVNKLSTTCQYKFNAQSSFLPISRQ